LVSDLVIHVGPVGVVGPTAIVHGASDYVDGPAAGRLKAGGGSGGV